MPSGVVEEVQSNKQDQSGVMSAAPPETKNGSNPKNSNKDDKENEEGVEVVLGDERNPTMVDSPRRMNAHDQAVFRPPQAVRPQAMRAPSGPPPPPHHHQYPHGPPYVQSSGSWGYPHPPSGEFRGARPYPVPPYNHSAPSFEDGAYHHHAPPPPPVSHYTPPVTYPGYRTSEEVNVISPNHKADPHYRPPHTPRSRHMPPPNYYHYPPASPVGRQEMMAPGTPGAMPRGRSHAPIRRGGAEGPYSRAVRGDYFHDEAGWGRYPISHSPGRERPHPSVVTESSFDSEHISGASQSHGSHPATPRSAHPHALPPQPVPPGPIDPHYQFYGGGGSWGSFDSAVGPPPHFDDQRYYGYPPDSPYGPYPHPPAPYSPNEIYRADSFHAHPGVHPVYSGHHHPHPGSYPYSYDEDERAKGYHSDGKDKKGRMTPKTSNKSNSSNMLLPKAAEEVDFDVTDPPAEPLTQPSDKPLCESLADVNGYDVLCGRGGGTNSQIGNRRFRKLVQEFQPTYLLARRKEKPLLARSIVLIIRKRGGRFLKKDDDTGELYEVGDTKAEAKTSQALREGLDVRATKSAASSLLEKKKKKQQEEAEEAAAEAAAAIEEESSPKSRKSSPEPAPATIKEEKTPTREQSSPPTLPRLQGEEVKSGNPHPHSPEQFAHSKRRRTRPVTAPSDRFFPEFCPPRAELGRPTTPVMDDDSSIALAATPIRRHMSRDDSDRYQEPRGCAGIAFDVMTGAATGSFCLGPTGWRR